MKITLHIGAHRCATTTFQHYVRGHHAMLESHKLGFWGPRQTRDGLLSGVFPGPRAATGRSQSTRAEGRIRMRLATAAKHTKRLLISDENMIGSARHCLRRRQLYPAMGERMARLSSAFGEDVDRVVLGIRAQDLWWASATAYTVGRGHPVPRPQALEEIAACPRTWRDVIMDLACAMPNTEILVAPFEQYGGQPNKIFEVSTDVPAPADPASTMLNRSPDMRALRKQLANEGGDPDLMPDETGRWQPFNAAQCAQLQENYADDLHWLTAGAEGLATLIQETTRIKTGNNLQADVLTEGNENDIGQQEMARSG